MKSLALTIALFFLITVSLEGKLRVDSEWGGGFYATINIPVTRNVTDDEWEIEVRFDQPVTIDAPAGNLKSKVGNSHYTYKNKFHNGRVIAGSTLDFPMLVYGSLEMTSKNLLAVTFDKQPVDIRRA